MDPEHLLYKYIQLRGAKLRTDTINGVRMSSLTVKPRPGRPDHGHVVLLHGIGSSGAHFIQVIFRIAAMGYTVHVPDLPGHGLSSDFPGRLTSDHLFETVAQWMAKVAPEKFALIGNSLGGALSWRYAGREPERISKLILLSPAVGFSSNEIWQTFADSLAVPNRLTAFKFLDRLMGGSMLVSPVLAPPIYKNMNRRAVRDLLETTQFSQFELQHRIAEVKVPTVLVWGTRDRLLPKSNLDWIKRSMAEHVVLLEPKGVGHCPQLCSPRWLYRILRDSLPKRPGELERPRAQVSTETASP